MLQIILKWAVASTLLLLGVKSATAAECDFDKPVGTCTAKLKILSTAGSKPSFSAEILVSSTVKSCSKVEWFLDSTPQITILKSKNSDTASVFGTSAIKKQDISIEKCTVYAEKGAAGSGKSDSRYGSCADSAEARAILDEFNATKPISYSLPKIRATLPDLKSMLADAQRARSANSDASAKKKAQLDRDVALLQETVDWGNNALRVLERCAK